METIDLRSDTVTKPTPAMREAMAEAKVGDDVYGEDPTVNQLQELAAEITGKEAGLYVPSGTMGNLAAVLAHCTRGDEIILGNLAHTFLYEAGGIAALGGVHPHTVQNQADGTINLEDIESAISFDDPHFAPTNLIALESTHNRCGGVALTREYIGQVKEIATDNNLKLHLDGARVFNATVSLGVSPKEYLAPFDSVTFCLSKGLSAPVGSVLCGSSEFIYRAHRIRKQLGGGMRQAGILAAAGIVALDKMVDRLADDHTNASTLAEKIDAIDGFDVYAHNTNMVYIEMSKQLRLSEEEFLKKLEESNVKVGQVDPRKFRMVTHNWVETSQIEKVIQIFSNIAA